ncbi:MAG: hypothetical protein WCJ64_03460 [Rhodospirillaceae bacterium]
MDISNPYTLPAGAARRQKSESTGKTPISVLAPTPRERPMLDLSANAGLGQDFTTGQRALNSQERRIKADADATSAQIAGRTARLSPAVRQKSDLTLNQREVLDVVVRHSAAMLGDFVPLSGKELSQATGLPVELVTRTMAELVNIGVVQVNTLLGITPRYRPKL